MNIDNVIRLIQDAMQSNLETVILMLIVVTSLYLINIMFGTVLGTFTEEFIPKKFFFGFFKMLVADVGIVGFCYCLNLFALTLEQTKNISISAEFISTVQIFTILVVWALDLAKDITEKIKSMKTLKYVSYDDVFVQENMDTEEGLG